MSKQQSIIWVHYHTPDLLRESIEAAHPLRKDADFIVVDNGGLGSLDVDAEVIRSRHNLGYAAGINLGVAASRAERILVMNPDVLVRPGCLEKLFDSLQHYSIVGPSLYLDRDLTFRMPPSDRRDFVPALIAELGRRRAAWTRYARRQWRKHASRYWQCGAEFCSSYSLSGAIMGFKRKTYDMIGPWDEGFRLYFEETDWLRRARSLGVTSAHVPSAFATHLYARSSRHQPQAATWFTESKRRFEDKHYRAWQRLLLRAAAKWEHEATRNHIKNGTMPSGPAFAELSNLECGYPAARARSNDPGRFQTRFDDVLMQLPPADYWLRWVDHSGAECLVTRYSTN